MALKDWKLVSKWTDYYPSQEWIRKDDKYSYVKVFKTGLPSSEIKRRDIKPYIINARVGINGELTKRYFKTKSMALKAAKSYRRTH